MKILLNGKSIDIEGEVSLIELLERNAINPDHVVVALNMTCIPKENLAAQTVRENDEIEALSPMFGG